MSDRETEPGPEQDAFIAKVSHAATHVSRYKLFYIVGLLFVLALASIPIVGGNDKKNASKDSAVAAGGADAFDNTQTGLDPGTAPTDATAPGTETGAAPIAGDSRPPARNVAQSLAAAKVQTGKTRGGIECKTGVRQIPISTYAAPCTAAWQGNNGGATYTGVTKDKITIVNREFPDSANSQAVDAVVAAAGGASEDTVKEIRDKVWVPYFNKMFELYGRQVQFTDYESQNGDSTAEAQSKGREGACADATQIQSELKPFLTRGSVSAPFAECAGERKMLAMDAAAYYPETFYKKYDPYLWAGVMECERIAYQLSEYIGKRLMNKKAQWAGDPLFQQTKRRFGTYVPDNDGYQSCVDIAERELRTKWGGETKPPRYDYQLDVSRFPDQAAQAMVQFKAAGVTTVVTACDPISIIFMTQAAEQQEYHPEWLGIGTALQDTDNAARLYEQNQVNGHLFGMSQLGATTKVIGPNSEPGRLYKLVTGKEIPPGTDGTYFRLVGLYSALQAAGPNLTVQAYKAALRSLPPGGAPDFPVGWTSYQDGPDGTKGAGDHTAVDDAREIYWVSEPGTGTAVGEKPRDPYYAGPADGTNGTYKETYNGKRFRNGEWPAENPPIYPPRGK